MSSVDGQDQLLDEQIAYYRARADEYLDGVIAELVPSVSWSHTDVGAVLLGFRHPCLTALELLEDRDLKVCRRGQPRVE